MKRTLFAGFDWDQSNRAKCGKPSLTIADVEHILASAPPFLAPDVKH